MCRIMYRKRLSKKCIVFVICCLTIFVILKFVPDKMSYSVERLKDNYTVSIFNNRGKKIYEDTYRLEPNVSKIGENTVMVTIGRGDSWTTKFINGKTNRISDGFENISAYNEKLVVYGTYEDEELKIIIRDIYDKEKAYEEVIDAFPDVAVGSYIIKDAQIIDNHSVHITYYVDSNWEEKEKLIFLD